MKSVGVDISPPKRVCKDSCCPFHGSLRVRGRLFHGKAVSVKARGTVVVEKEYLHYVKKYMRYEKRRSRVHAHLPPCIELTEDGSVTIGECRPIAKTVSFVVLEGE